MTSLNVRHNAKRRLTTDENRLKLLLSERLGGDEAVAIAWPFEYPTSTLRVMSKR